MIMIQNEQYLVANYSIPSFMLQSQMLYDCGLRQPYDVKMVKFARCPYARREIFSDIFYTSYDES